MKPHSSGRPAPRPKRPQPARSKRSSNEPADPPKSFRVGRVTAYLRGRVWYIRYHENGTRIQRRVGPNKVEAEQLAAEINAQVQCGLPSAFGFEQCLLTDLRKRWLAHHEDINRSSLATISRYRTATAHLIEFADERTLKHPSDFTTRNVEAFVRFLRTAKVAANGHKNSRKRYLRDAGVKFILQTCSNLFNYAKKHRHLPPYQDNPFSTIGIANIPIEDAKPIAVFTRAEERRFLESCDDWQFPVMVTLMQTGMRPRELVRLLLPGDLDLEKGWIHITNKPRLGWQVKTRRERSVPVTDELVRVLRWVVGARTTGPVFQQRRCRNDHNPPLQGWDLKPLEHEVLRRAEVIESENANASGRTAKRIASESVWRDLGAIRYDYLRNQFIKVMKALGRPDITTLKTCRHNFATCMQDANIDPLIRNELLGHSPGGLGMTTRYTQTRPETKRSQLLAMLATQESTAVAREWLDGCT